jgi:peptidoglycan/LPS O-acetylase OafA/YrhL
LLKREMPGLDALRGVAILSVFSYHGLKWSRPVTPMTGPHVEQLAAAASFGWLGVNLFFVLSGFLITGILIDTRTREDSLRSFYVRRVLRILPVYVVALALIKVMVGVTWSYLALCLFYLANFAKELLGAGTGYGPLWSLAVEEQFYLVWPFAVRRLGLQTLGFGCVVGVLITPDLRALSVANVVPLGDPYRATWLVCDNLFYGALVAIFLRSEGSSELHVRRLTRWTGILGIVSLGVGFMFHAMSRVTPVGAGLQPLPFQLLFTCFLLLALQYGDHPTVYRAMAPLRFFGYISYGFYLFHMLGFIAFGAVTDRLGIHPETLTVGFMLFRFVVVGVGIALISWLSRRYFEEYFLRFKERLAPYTVPQNN